MRSAVQSAGAEVLSNVEPLRNVVLNAVTKTLQVVFVGPRSSYRMMRDAGIANKDFCVRSHIVLRVLQALLVTSPHLYGRYVPSQISLEQQQQPASDFNLLIDNAYRLDGDADINYERVATVLTSDFARADETGMYSPHPELSEGDTLDRVVLDVVMMIEHQWW